ncbi:unnamed protein product [Lepeophtheirus salmonis]|uniref:(salmon louse) hypothetical protein n=1 Tax=Lepeophtheirus salmonis TaxID=72036 RepID=A0A7R8CDY5_LEPSM|nr:unnamed protein product [Lepeophtheirus salmonis]CAF2790543.1 unnamed protein product [Lepeophtheirus salmonis]
MGKGDNGGFSQEQLDMYKECFLLMDIDKDGTINKNDLRGAFDNVGKLMSDGELDEMLSEVGGTCSYDSMIKMFQEKMAGGTNDSDDLIVSAFKAFDTDGKVEAEMFRHALPQVRRQVQREMISLFVAGGGEEKVEETKEEEKKEEAPADSAPAAEGGKKKKKKKKAAK